MSPARKGWGPRSIVMLVVLLASLPARLLAGLNEWSPIGMEDGGQVSGVAWHPTREGHVFAAVGSRIYRSVDRAQTWTDASLQRQIPHGVFAFDPVNPQRIYVSGDTVLRSDDGGATFMEATRLPVGAAQSIAVSPRDSALFAAHAGKVYRSLNGAQSWTDVSAGLPAASGAVPVLLAAPSDDGVVYLLQDATRLYRTTDNGNSWLLLAEFGASVGQILINPFIPSEMLARGTGSAAFVRRSNDGGITWSHLASIASTWLAYDPARAGHVFALQGHDLIMSTDGGVTWGAVSRLQSSQVTGIGAVSRSGLLAFGTVEGVHASEDSGATIHLKSRGIRAGVLRSLDMPGTTPHKVLASFFGGPEGIHELTATGWRQWDVAALRSAFDGPAVIADVATAADGLTTYAAASSGGVASTRDGGASWLPSSSVFRDQYVSALAADPLDPQVVYAATSTSGILRSENRGATWSSRNTGLPVDGTGVHVLDVVVNPHRPSHLYARLAGVPVLFASRDRGLTWQEISGLPSPPPRVPAFNRIDPDTLYVVSGFQLYRSLDSGSSWTPIPTPQPLPAINSVYFDSSTTGSLGIVLDSGGTGLHRTVDGGAHWEHLPWPASLEIRSGLHGDPSAAGKLLAATHGHGMYEFQVATDIRVALSGVASPVSRQSARTLAVEVRNAGPYAARDVVLTFSIPAVAIPGQLAVPRGTTCSGDATGRQWTCRLGVLLNGGSLTVTAPLTFAQGEGEFTASVFAHEAEQESRDNVAAQGLTVLPVSDVSVALTGVPAQMRVGDRATLVARVTNAGPDTASGIKLSTAIPPGLDAAISTVSQGGCSLAARMINCDLGALAPTHDAVVEVSLSALAAGTLPLSATALHAAVETSTANNTAILSIGVSRSAEVDPGAVGGGGETGGGGSTDWRFVIALSGLWALRANPAIRRFAYAWRPSPGKWLRWGRCRLPGI